MILMEEVEGKIWLRFPYSKVLVTDLKARVQGGRWVPSKEVWSYPLDWVTYTDLCKVLELESLDDDEYTIGPNLEEWAAIQFKRMERAPDVKDLHTLRDCPRIRTGNPKLWSAMESRPFQTITPLFADVHRSVLLADHPGLGKTLQTIGAAIEADVRGPILVVAPAAAVQITWPTELHRWVPEDKFGILGRVEGSRRADVLRGVFERCEADPTLRFWVLITSHYVRAAAEIDEYGKYIYDAGGVKLRNATLPAMFEGEWAGAVIDESHRFIAKATGNKKKQSAQMQGLGALKFKDDALKIAISGTPFRGKTENLYGTLEWLRPQNYTSFWKWVGKYYQVYEDGYGAKDMGEMKDEALFYHDVEHVMIRRTKGEVAKDLPPKVYGGAPYDANDPDSTVGVWLDMLPAQAKQYRSMVNDGVANLDGGDLLANGVLAEMTRLKQLSNSSHKMNEAGVPIPDLSASNKWEWIQEFLTDRGILGASPAPTGKVIIASQFTTMVNALAKKLRELEVECVTLTGETSDRDRRLAMERFQGDPAKGQLEKEYAKNDRHRLQGMRRPTPYVFLLNTAAGGVSLTLDAADDVVIVDETFIPDDQEQVEDRAHRLSRMHNVSIWYLRSRGTVEEAIGTTNTERESNCKGIMDGMRGVDIKKLIGKV